MMNGTHHHAYQKNAIQRYLDQIQLNVDRMKAAADQDYIQADEAEALVDLAGRLLRRVSMAALYEEIYRNGGINFDQSEKGP